jgi:hypothetical protein
MTVGHEVGHVIDHLAGDPIPGEAYWKGIPQSPEITDELQRVYSAGSTGVHRAGPLTLPQDFGYPPSDVPAELMAEGVRAYMTNPNYLKTVAPGTAAAIRAYVRDATLVRGS